jgi:hypothetical protein
VDARRSGQEDIASFSISRGETLLLHIEPSKRPRIRARSLQLPESSSPEINGRRHDISTLAHLLTSFNLADRLRCGTKLASQARGFVTETYTIPVLARLFMVSELSAQDYQSVGESLNSFINPGLACQTGYSTSSLQPNVCVTSPEPGQEK